MAADAASSVAVAYHRVASGPETTSAFAAESSGATATASGSSGSSSSPRAQSQSPGGAVAVTGAGAGAVAGGASPSASHGPARESGRKRKRRKGVAKRLRTELAQLMTENCAGIVAFPGTDILHWTGKIDGPPKTVYEGFTYTLSIKFTIEYPYVAPNVKFVTPCYHPNVDTGGNICLDILNDKWSAAYTTSTVLLSIQSLLASPNNSDPLNSDAAHMWSDQKAFAEVVRSLAQQPP